MFNLLTVYISQQKKKKKKEKKSFNLTFKDLKRIKRKEIFTFSKMHYEIQTGKNILEI